MRTIAALLAAAGGGCVAVDGGAVALQWRIHDGDGRDVDCAGAEIDQVRLVLEPAPADLDDAARTFSCERGRRGEVTTEFRVPPGRYRFAVQALRDGTVLGAADDVCVPAPVQDVVREGGLTDLEVLLIIVGCDGAER